MWGTGVENILPGSFTRCVCSSFWEYSTLNTENTLINELPSMRRTLIWYNEDLPNVKQRITGLPICKSCLQRGEIISQTCILILLRWSASTLFLAYKKAGNLYVIVTPYSNISSLPIAHLPPIASTQSTPNRTSLYQGTLSRGRKRWERFGDFADYCRWRPF